MRVVLAIAAVTGLFIGTPTLAGEALAKNHNCLACHQMDKKTVGPAYKEVAAKYKGKNAAAQLEQKVKKGGQGVWGPVPMPPNAAVPDADITKLIDWILKMG